ncbi:hypothetical protein C8J57DRAFT_195829 [Mycena rebaudengoi]|nr:hypothetical protein C8J57DRAFT_195829 [Mycena rebaudengoi]
MNARHEKPGRQHVCMLEPTPVTESTPASDPSRARILGVQFHSSINNVLSYLSRTWDTWYRDALGHLHTFRSTSFHPSPICTPPHRVLWVDLRGTKCRRDGSFDYSAVFPRFLPPAVPNRRCKDLGSRAFNGWRRRTCIRRVHTLLNPLLWPRSSTRRPPIAITQSTSGAPSPSTGRDAQSSSSRLEPNPIRSTLGGWFAPTLLRAVCANAAACSSREWFAPTSLRAPLTHDAAIHKGIIR